MEKKKSRFIAAIIMAMLGCIVWGLFILWKDAAMWLVYIFAAWGFVSFGCGLFRWLRIPEGSKY